ncbi:hypothetical protein GGI23_002239 [Coemansia sp. RSA 2559]|nr:hypothetical protein GGI23_002239 [Coemansia sp. RSA 2559]
MSACHGIMLTGWSVAAIGGGLTYTGIVNMLTSSKGYTLDDPYVYVVNQYWILALLVCGWVSLAFVRITPSERMFPRVHGQIHCHMFAGLMFRLAKGTEQRGLHDYVFLTAATAAAAEGASLSHDEPRVGTNSSTRTNVGPLHGSSKMEDVSLGAASGSGVEMGGGQKRGAGDSATVRTYLQDSSVFSKTKKQQQASEAFNYISDAVSSSSDDRNETRISFVQLMCATPPPRRCLRLFGRWRFELLTREEVGTVWRMYLSCALLASSTNEKGFR